MSELKERIIQNFAPVVSEYSKLVKNGANKAKSIVREEGVRAAFAAFYVAQEKDVSCLDIYRAMDEQGFYENCDPNYNPSCFTIMKATRYYETLKNREAVSDDVAIEEVLKLYRVSEADVLNGFYLDN